MPTYGHPPTMSDPEWARATDHVPKVIASPRGGNKRVGTSDDEILRGTELAALSLASRGLAP